MIGEDHVKWMNGWFIEKAEFVVDELGNEHLELTVGGRRFSIQGNSEIGATNVYVFARGEGDEGTET